MEKIDFRAEGKQLAWDYLLVTLGALLTAFAFAAFFLPHDIAPGGVTGIATVLSSVTGLNVGLLSFLINLPLFAIGWRRVGLRFAVRSFISMILLSLFIDVMPEFDLAGNMMLAAIFGGVTMGAGLGLVVRAGATTGGTDMAAMIVHEHWSMFTVPMVLFAIDGIVVIIAALNFGVQAGLFALGVAVYIDQNDGFGHQGLQHGDAVPHHQRQAGGNHPPDSHRVGARLHPAGGDGHV